MTPLEQAVAAFEYRFALIGYIAPAIENCDEIDYLPGQRPPPVIRLSGGGEVTAGKNFSEAAPGLPFTATHVGCALGNGNDECGDTIAHETEESAIAALFAILNAQADEARDQGRSFLVWRSMPETDRYKGHKQGEIDPITMQPYPEDKAPYWRAYARLAIIADPRLAAVA